MSSARILDLKDLGLTVHCGSQAINPQPFRVFSDEACAFLDELSRELLHDKRARRYPDVVSFAYWIRKANIARKKALWDAGVLGLSARLGRGLSLHIAPSNVAVNFAFSWVFGLLSGNGCIVRVPSRRFPQIPAILGVAKRVLAHHPEINCRTAFVNYEAGSEVTKRLSQVADVRVIWGGDETVGLIRSLPSKPRVVDVAFADRYSVSVLSARAVLAASESVLKSLVAGFYNDTYLMDQNACSSPRVVYWLEDAKSSSLKDAKDRFWRALSAHATQRYDLQPAVLMDKFVQACRDSADLSIEKVLKSDGMVYVGELAQSREDLDVLRGVGGYFYERVIPDFDGLLRSVTAKWQTITYFGIDGEQLRSRLMDGGILGIDRIVPVGQAMDIDLVWDGYDLIATMSRAIDVR